jgi:RNA polymerase sigma-70 factor (ECF subfamily)
MTDQQTSLTLLQRLRANESDAWQTVVQLYTPLVYHWCARGGVRGADADDVLQEVLQATATHFADFRRDRPGDSFRGWLRGITKNKILMHLRRTGRQPQASGGTDAFRTLQEIADGSIDTDDEDDRPELDALHRRALELSRGRRRCHGRRTDRGAHGQIARAAPAQGSVWRSGLLSFMAARFRSLRSLFKSFPIFHTSAVTARAIPS